MADKGDARGEQKAGGNERDVHLAEIARALREIVAELKEANVSLKAIARSQAQQATPKRNQSS